MIFFVCVCDNPEEFYEIFLSSVRGAQFDCRCVAG